MTVQRVCLESRKQTDAPTWAVLQRQLIAAIDEAAPIFLDKYTHPGGELIWRTGPQDEDNGWADDLYEAFFNWPHYYALGGGNYAGEMAGREWNAITRQLVDLDQVTDEFVNACDWFHNGENYIYLYNLGMATPGLAGMEARARRFAGWYIGEDDQVPNYDPVHRVIPSPFSGSRGPMVHFPLGMMTYHLGNRSANLGPESTLGPGRLPERWFEDEALTRQVRENYDRVLMREDIPLNLTATAMVTHAYLYTGEAKFRDWVLEYTETWIERMEKNGGIIPDNVGRTGKIGEYRNGEWWGGFYGWPSKFAPFIITNGLAIAAECAHLLTGDDRYLQLLRTHLHDFLERAVEEEGKLLIPGRYLDGEWIFSPMRADYAIHLWAASMEDRDKTMLERIRRGSEEEWLEPRSNTVRFADDRAWTRYLAGQMPDYPERVLQSNYREVCRRLDEVMRDDADLTQVHEHHWQDRNPVHVEALTHLTTGGPQTIYWGGLAQGRVRHFDFDRRRPGLPEDVAALVSGVSADGAELTLVNLSPSRTRRALIAAGSFGEHRFSSVRADGNETAVAVDDTYLAVELRPASEIDLRLGMERYCNKPSYALPW